MLVHITNNTYPCVIYDGEEQTYGCCKSNIHHVASLKVPNVPWDFIVLKTIYLHIVSESSKVRTQLINTCKIFYIHNAKLVDIFRAVFLVFVSVYIFICKNESSLVWFNIFVDDKWIICNENNLFLELELLLYQSRY